MPEQTNLKWTDNRVKICVFGNSGRRDKLTSQTPEVSLGALFQFVPPVVDPLNKLLKHTRSTGLLHDRLVNSSGLCLRLFTPARRIQSITPGVLVVIPKGQYYPNKLCFLRQQGENL